jgi:predicted nucleotidyltransferase
MLLYSSQEKEYKQAKIRATKTLGVKVLPSNLEVATELDKIADEREGASRRDLLLRMRKEALRIMGVLRDFHPRLIGSVWRGTAHRNSDIDVSVFSSYTEEVLKRLKKNGFPVTRTEWRSKTNNGRMESSFHIHLILPTGDKAEIVVRDEEKKCLTRICEIYGDVVTGLNHSQLQRLLEETSFKRFISKEIQTRE